MHKSAITLADGRELIYFDATAGQNRGAPDTRPLHPIDTHSEVRHDPLLDAWVIVASHRQNRTYFPDPDDCPLCPSRPGHPTEVPAEDYEVAVFENRFPSLSGPEPLGPFAEPVGLVGRSGPGSGRCEVVCFTDAHDASFAGLSPERVGLVLEAWTDRSVTLAGLEAVEEVFCFENRGAEIGVTQQHPHGQIYAYPYVTPRTRRMLTSTTEHLARTGRNLFDDVLADALGAGRVVAENDEWVAFVPHAARWPYEVHLYPRRRVAGLGQLASAARAAFAPIYLDLLGRFDRLFARPAPYIAGWHQAPVREGAEHFACHLELFTVRRTDDKLKYLAGSESGMDAFANDVAPEAAAERLRAAGA